MKGLQYWAPVVSSAGIMILLSLQSIGFIKLDTLVLTVSAPLICMTAIGLVLQRINDYGMVGSLKLQHQQELSQALVRGGDKSSKEYVFATRYLALKRHLVVSPILICVADWSFSRDRSEFIEPEINLALQFARLDINTHRIMEPGIIAILRNGGWDQEDTRLQLHGYAEPYDAKYLILLKYDEDSSHPDGSGTMYMYGFQQKGLVVNKTFINGAVRDDTAETLISHVTLAAPKIASAREGAMRELAEKIMN